jgi:hypothetical protein
MPPQLRLNPRRSAECEGALFFGLLSNFTTASARQAHQAYWPPILQTSTTFGNEPLKSVKSHTVTVEMELLRRALVGESVVVTGLELTGFITGAAKVGAFEVGVFDVTPLIPLD